MSTTLRIPLPWKALLREPKVKKNKLINDKLTEIISNVNALLNSNGGYVVLYTKDGTYSHGDVDDIVRRIEQKVGEFSGQIAANKVFNLETITEREITFRVEMLPTFSQPCTVNYNLHIPTETQVTLVPPSEKLDVVADIVRGTGRKRKLKDHRVIGQHQRHFVLGETVPLQESKSIQLKKLNDDKRDLEKRVKNNKLTHYVAAFANHDGGHIYYGIKANDDGWNVVEGQTVHNQNKIIKEVTQYIKNMTWPTEYGPPERGKHWDIFFEPVLGCGGSEQKFMIVISVAPSPQGVFTEEPESYEVVGGKVIKLGFQDWKKRLCQYRISDRSEASEFVDIQPHVTRCSWSSSRACNEFARISQDLLQFLNNANRSDFLKLLKELQEGESSVNARIISQCQEAGYRLRDGDVMQAEKLLADTEPLLRSRECTDPAILEIKWLYWMCHLKRSKPGTLGKSEEYFTNAIQKMQTVEHSLIGPWLVVQKARIMENKISDECESEEDDDVIRECKEYYIEALRQATGLHDSVLVVAFKQKMYINLSRIHLGCFHRRNKCTRKKVCTKFDLEEAENMLENVDRSRNRYGWPWTLLCEGEYLLARTEQEIRNWERLKYPNDLYMSAYRRNNHVLAIAEELNFKSLSSYASDQQSYLKNLVGK